jgi:hypothetical protein
MQGKTKLQKWKALITNPKQGLNEIKQGILTLPPHKQLAAQLAGIKGNIIGLLFAWAFLLIKGLWFFSITMFFVVFLQIISYIGTKQKYDTMVLLNESADAKHIDELIGNLR